MNCLVTGGAGFIGSNLAIALMNRGYNVRVLDNFSTGKRENIRTYLKRIDLVEGDLRSYNIVHEATKDVDLIFHQGALASIPRSIKDPITTSHVNIGGTLNILNGALTNP